MADRRYSKNGEWALREGAVWKVGLSASAAHELGEITFVEAPALGTTARAGDAVCAVEAVKAAADFYLPVSGRVVAVNPNLAHNPALVNQSPEGEGWILALDDVEASDWEALLDEESWARWEAGH